MSLRKIFSRLFSVKRNHDHGYGHIYQEEFEISRKYPGYIVEECILCGGMRATRPDGDMFEYPGGPCPGRNDPLYVWKKATAKAQNDFRRGMEWRNRK